jgi:hypothetical protein
MERDTYDVEDPIQIPRRIDEECLIIHHPPHIASLIERHIFAWERDLALWRVRHVLLHERRVSALAGHLGELIHEGGVEPEEVLVFLDEGEGAEFGLDDVPRHGSWETECVRTLGYDGGKNLGEGGRTITEPDTLEVEVQDLWPIVNIVGDI